MTKKQLDLMDDLTFWHAMEAMAEEESRRRDLVASGLCSLAAAIARGDKTPGWWNEEIDDHAITKRCMERAKDIVKPTQAFWWPFGKWTARLDFCRQMIADTERQLERA